MNKKTNAAWKQIYQILVDNNIDAVSCGCCSLELGEFNKNWHNPEISLQEAIIDQIGFKSLSEEVEE